MQRIGTGLYSGCGGAVLHGRQQRTGSTISDMRALTHIKKLDDCFGDFLLRVKCSCGASREIAPEALARLVAWSMTLEQLAQRMRCSRCGKKAAEVVAVARPRPRGVPKNPH
jgi:hypothetical protein